MIGVVLASSLLLGQATPQSPPPKAQQPPTAITPTVDVTAKRSEAEMVVSCRMITPTGTRFGEKMCARKYEWENYTREGIAYLQRLQGSAEQTSKGFEGP